MEEVVPTSFGPFQTVAHIKKVKERKQTKLKARSTLLAAIYPPF